MSKKTKNNQKIKKSRMSSERFSSRICLDFSESLVLRSTTIFLLRKTCIAYSDCFQRYLSSDGGCCSWIVLGSSTLPRPGHIRENAWCQEYGQYPDYGQFSLSIFRTSKVDVQLAQLPGWAQAEFRERPGWIPPDKNSRKKLY